MNMNTVDLNFIVTLQIIFGEVEKTTRHLVTADSSIDAGRTAIIDESHDPEGLEWEKETPAAYDLGGTVYYRVKKVRIVDSIVDWCILTNYLKGD